MTKAIIVRIEGDYVITAEGADLLSAIASQASDARDEAVAAAAVALAAGGVGEYPDTGAGLSGTTEGETFWVDMGDGTGQVYRHDPGPTATPLQKFIIDPTDSGAADIFAGGVPTLAALDSSTGGGMVRLADGRSTQQAIDGLDSTVGDLDETVNAIDPRVSGQSVRTLTPMISSRLPTFRVWEVNGYGPGGVNHNLDAEGMFREMFGGSMGGTGTPSEDRYVDWYNGDDSNNGRGATPYKTLQKALETATGDIWLLNDSEELIDFDGTERTAGGGARAMAVRGYNGRKAFIGAGLKAADVTWTDTTGGLKVCWTFTNTPGSRAEAILYAADGDVKNGVLIPFRGTGADASDAEAKASTELDGWSQVGTTGDIYLRFWSNMDIEAEKDKFFIAYGANPHSLKGPTLYFEDVDFLGGGGVQLLDSAVTPSTFKANIFFRNCDVMFAAVAGLDPSLDSFVVAQGCRFSRNSGDGIGPHGSSVTLLADCRANFNGSVRTYFGVINPARNRQGLSTHEDSFAMAVACDFQNNYGQSCANTTTTDTTVSTHLIGCDLRNPWQGDGARNNIIAGDYCLETYGKAYVDTCLTGGATSVIGWVVGSGEGYGYRNQLQGTTAPSSSGIELFDPFGVLP